MSAEPSDSLIGQVLDERYALEALIGFGGMSRIYRGLDRRLHRTVAVKVLNESFAADAEVRERFASEAVIAANLSHVNVLNIRDHNASGQLVYLVMDYVRGQNLHQLITTRGRLTPRQTLSLLEDICRGLSAAHREEIVHRDMKPANVLISNTGDVKIADFGLARAASAHTQSPTLLATLSYASPELLTGQPADARSDIYAVGVMIYQMLTGHVPYPEASLPALLNHHLNEEMPLPSLRVPGLAQDLDELVRFCTERDPENRPQDAGFLLDEIIQIRATLDDAQLDLGAETYGGLKDLLPRATPAPTTMQQRLGQWEAAKREAARDPWWVEQEESAATEVLDADAEATTVVDASAAPTQALDAGGHPQTDLHPSPQAGPVVPAPSAEPFLPASTLAMQRPDAQAPEQNEPEAAPLSKRQRARADRQWRKEAQIPTHRLAKPRSAGRRIVNLVLVLLAIALVSAAAWFFGRGPGSIISIPQLSGLLQAQAVAQLDEAQVPVRIDNAYHDDVAVGRVIASDPTVGSSIMRFQGVELVVSRGPQSFRMPDLTGMGAEEARGALAEMQLREPAISEDYSSTVKEGLVISSTPASGKQLTRKTGTALVLSAGPAPVKVPNLAGMDESAARAAVQEAGLELRLGEPVYSSEVPAGQVAVQEPQDGTVDAGSRITVQLSQGPEYLSIPSVIGQSIQEARSVLETAGFQVETRRMLGERSDTVRMQTPLNQQAERGSTITIYAF